FKRPPTPPLARRHSQMRHDKARLSRHNSARLSLPPGAANLTPSSSYSSTALKTPPPPPPPSRRVDREPAEQPSQPTSPFRQDGVAPPIDSPGDEIGDSLSFYRAEAASMLPSKRIPRTPTSQSSPVIPPPPPPPRRTGGASRS